MSMTHFSFNDELILYLISSELNNIIYFVLNGDPNTMNLKLDKLKILDLMQTEKEKSKVQMEMNFNGPAFS